MHEKLRALRKKVAHFLENHEWELISKTDDWLQGGTYTYKCKKCPKTMETRPYQGGAFWS